MILTAIYLNDFNCYLNSFFRAKTAKDVAQIFQKQTRPFQKEKKKKLFNKLMTLSSNFHYSVI